jgi:hypothetical protein
MTSDERILFGTLAVASTPNRQGAGARTARNLSRQNGERIRLRATEGGHRWDGRLNRKRTLSRP